MKKFILVLTAVLMIAVLGACSANKTESEVVEDKPSMFVKIEDGPFWNVYYHKVTKVMYVVSASTYNSGDFTLLVNPDGSPMLYENTKED